MAFRLFQTVATRRIQYLQSVSKQYLRSDSIFTKYREPPNGFLFNEKPLKPGERRKLESWEPIWYAGWGMVIFLSVVGAYYKPDDNLLTWARREAEIRIAEIEEEEMRLAEIKDSQSRT